jgi:hypothetical protein
MSYDPTLIGNLALGHLGDRAIDDISDGQDSVAEILSTFYGHARDTVYQAHDWKWAKRVLPLQRKNIAPSVRYAYAYALPSSYQRLSNVSDSSTMSPQLDDFDIVDGQLTTDSEAVYLEFVAGDWSEGTWPAYFADCVALKLAILASPRISHDLQYRQALIKTFSTEVLPYSRSIDSQSQPARKPFIRSEWTGARFSGRSFSSNLRRT